MNRRWPYRVGACAVQSNGVGGVVLVGVVGRIQVRAVAHGRTRCAVRLIVGATQLEELERSRVTVQKVRRRS